MVSAPATRSVAAGSLALWSPVDRVHVPRSLRTPTGPAALRSVQAERVTKSQVRGSSTGRGVPRPQSRIAYSTSTAPTRTPRHAPNWKFHIRPTVPSHGIRLMRSWRELPGESTLTAPKYENRTDSSPRLQTRDEFRRRVSPPAGYLFPLNAAPAQSEARAGTRQSRE